MPHLCSVIVSIASSINKPLAIQKQTTSTSPSQSPVKTSSKGWLVHTAPLNQSQMSPQKLFLSFPHSTPLSNLSFPFSSPRIPFPVRDCVVGRSSAVVIWQSRWLAVFFSLCLKLSLPLHISVARISIFSSRRGPYSEPPQRSESFKVKN